jgi:hypothetical protein
MINKFYKVRSKKIAVFLPLKEWKQKYGMSMFFTLTYHENIKNGSQLPYL